MNKYLIGSVSIPKEKASALIYTELLKTSWKFEGDYDKIMSLSA